MISRESLNNFKKKGSLTFPKVVQIEITNRCPLRCSQCYKSRLSNDEIDYDKLISFIDEGIDNGTTLFVLNGGEPLEYYRFMDVIHYLTEREVCFNCFTSGYGLSDDIILCAKQGFMNLSISLNGSLEEINKLSRDGYKYAIAAIQALSIDNAPFMINWVARHDNVQDFPNVVQLAKKYHSVGVSVIGNKMAHNQIVESPLDLDDYNFLSNYILTHNSENDARIFIEQCFPTLSTMVEGLTKNMISGCNAGIYGCHITLDEYFMPCTQLHYKERYETIEDYWSNSKILQKLRNIEKKNLMYCGDCSKKYCNFCRASERQCHDDFFIGYKSCPIREV